MARPLDDAPRGASPKFVAAPRYARPVQERVDALKIAGIPLLDVTFYGNFGAPFTAGVMAWDEHVVLFEREADADGFKVEVTLLPFIYSLEVGHFDISYHSPAAPELLKHLAGVGHNWADGSSHQWVVNTQEDLNRFVLLLKEKLGEPLHQDQVEAGDPQHAAMTTVLEGAGLQEFECD